MPFTYRQHLDERDGAIYNCVLMPDGKWWAAENLRYDNGFTVYPGGLYSNIEKYGRLYLLADRAAALPTGTRLPSLTDVQNLPSTIDLFSDESGGTNAYGFNLLPAGGAIYGNPEDFGQRSYTAVNDTIDTMWCTLPDFGRYYTGYGTDSLKATSIRFIVDTFNDPHQFKIFGINFDGFERGMTVTHSRPIDVVDSIGGSVRLIPHGPAILDEWRVQSELWVKSELAEQLEDAIPPHGTPADRSIYLPPRNGGASFPGLLPALAGENSDRYDNVQVTRFESQGRKGPILDLHGYFLDFTLRTWADGETTNPSTTPTVTPPTWLSQKFAARQLQDWSVETATVTSGGFQTGYIRSPHGRRKDVNLNLDHLTDARANELVAFYRGVRHNSATISVDNGPLGIQSISVYLVGLQLHRTGLYWDGTLETVLA